jgi:Bacterial Ig-like domain
MERNSEMSYYPYMREWKLGMAMVLLGLAAGCAAASDGDESSTGTGTGTGTGMGTGGMGTGGMGTGGMGTGGMGTGGMGTGGMGTGGMGTGGMGTGGMGTGGRGTGGRGTGGMGTGGMGTGGMGTGGMGTGGMGTGGMGDTTPPTVVSITPSDGATAVATVVVLSVTFSEAVNPATVTTDSTTSCTGSIQLSADGFTSCVPLTAPISADDTTFSFSPAAPLDSATNYALAVTTTVEDAASNALAAPFQTANGITVRYTRTIVVDGSNDFAASDAVPTSTPAGQLYVSYDDTNLYLGLAHPDVQQAGTGNKFAYFILSTDPALATGNALSSDSKAKFGAAGTAMLEYHWKERIDGPAYSEYKVGDAAGWATNWPGTGKAAARGAGFVEGSIALADLGNPALVIVTAYSVDYAGDNGNGWLYNMVFGANDGPAATPRDAYGFVQLTLPTSQSPNDPAHQMVF